MFKNLFRARSASLAALASAALLTGCATSTTNDDSAGGIGIGANGRPALDIGGGLGISMDGSARPVVMMP
jgi:hypothetical protein